MDVKLAHSLHPHDVIQRLETDADSGLTSADVTARRETFGENRIGTEKRAHWIDILRRQFADVLILILLVAALVSVAVGEWADAITIVTIVLLNGVLGFAQEWKAERALLALKNMLTPRCKVIRDGNECEVDAYDLVPGDIVILDTGDRVPADLRLIQCVHLNIDESALTGESVAVSKLDESIDDNASIADRTNMAWMGTSVTSGRAQGVVVATGGHTEFGRIAEMTQEIGSEPTPLQRKLTVVGKQLGIAAISISGLVAATGALMGKPLTEMFFTGVSLAVAVVPEGLPTVVTLTMAIGIRQMVRQRALLRRLRAAEGLGSATVICTDKTGTLTQNQMTVTKIWTRDGLTDVTGVGYDPAGHFERDGCRIDYRNQSDLLSLLNAGLHCNHAKLTKDKEGWHEIGEPTESALVVAAYKAWLDPDEIRHVAGELPFDSTRKCMSVIEDTPDGCRIAFVKGAPEVILEKCSQILDGTVERELSETDRLSAVDAIESMATTGLRTLAIAQRKIDVDCPIESDCVENELTLLGIVGMMDPPRLEVPEAIKLSHSAGIRVVMITGDSGVTASAIANQIGLQSKATLTGSELDAMNDDALADILQEEIVFARTTPEHKLRIVRLLQSMNEIVAMTGDGVNDAPALKKADVGIAMGCRGTDVAKGASDIVLTDDNFSSIVGAIQEGRRQYDNIQKFVRYLLSSNAGEVIAIFLNIIFGGPLILLPVQILWMNLVTDGLTAVALGMEPAEKSVMRRPPRDPNQPMLTWSAIAMILILGSYVGVATLWLFQYYLASGDDAESLAIAQTVAFTGIIVIEKANVLNFRSLQSPISSIGFFSNPWVLIAVLSTFLLQAAAVYVPFLQNALHTVPLGWNDWLFLIIVALPISIGTECFKYGRSKLT